MKRLVRMMVMAVAAVFALGMGAAAADGVHVESMHGVTGLSSCHDEDGHHDEGDGHHEEHGDHDDDGDHHEGGNDEDESHDDHHEEGGHHHN